MARGRSHRAAGRPQAIEFRIEGVEELVAALSALADRASGVLMEAVLAGAQVIADEANLNAPGPHVETAVDAIGPGSVSVAIGPDKAHWYYLFAETGAQPHEIEARRKQILTGFGWSGDAAIFDAAGMGGVVDHPGIVAQPFLRPAVDNKGQAAIDALADRIREEIERGLADS